MPIKVIKIGIAEKGRPTLTPGLIFHRDHNGKISDIRLMRSHKHYHFDNDVLKDVTSVFTESETNVLFTEIHNKIEENKKEVKKEIQDSLGEIQNWLRELQDKIIGSTSFRDAIKEEVLKELREELKEK